MARGAGIRLPKVPTHKALYAKKVNVKTIEKIDKIYKETGLSKHLIIDKLLSTSLGIKTSNSVDLTKYLKKGVL